MRGGNVKWRALRLDTGNYSWGSEAVTRKTRILDVVYNASNNELVRTQTLVKSAIVQVDAAPFKQWYLQHYGVDIGRKKKAPAAAAKKEATEVSCSSFISSSSVTGVYIVFAIYDYFRDARIDLFKLRCSDDSLLEFYFHVHSSPPKSPNSLHCRSTALLCFHGLRNS